LTITSRRFKITAVDMVAIEQARANVSLVVYM